MRRRKSTKVTYDITGKVLVKYLDKTAVSFTVPDGVEKIADRAFAECRNIKSVKMTDSVTEIGDGAFYNCRSLETVKLSKNINKIGKVGETITITVKRNNKEHTLKVKLTK